MAKVIYYFLSMIRDRKWLNHQLDQFHPYNYLQELYLEHNKLKTLPDSLCKLVNLKTLTLSHNKLKHLPEDIGLLKSLHTLNIEENPVTKLPKSFYKLSQLTVLHLNCDQFCYPPSEVVKNGIEAIIKYICAGKFQL